MSTKRILSHEDVYVASLRLAVDNIKGPRTGGEVKIYGVPRGGVPVAYLVAEGLYRHSRGVSVVDRPEDSDIIVDDLIDSGATRERFSKSYGKPFLALFEKGVNCPKDEWLVFPWEETEEKSIGDAFTRLIQYIGEDPKRGGLVDTPDRMAKAWREWSSGYTGDPVAIIKTFEDGAGDYDEMVHQTAIPFYSHCEHHLAPFFGTVTFAYIPKGKIVGLSKFSRLIEVFARRLQVQERLTVQILDAFCKELDPLGAGIVIKARHLCMESRGIRNIGSVTTTAAFRGALKSKPEARAEFFSLIGGAGE